MSDRRQSGGQAAPDLFVIAHIRVRGGDSLRTGLHCGRDEDAAGKIRFYNISSWPWALSHLRAVR